MAVAEKPRTKTPAPSHPAQRLALASFVGALYLLFCLGFVLTGFPYIWELAIGAQLNNPFLSTSLLLIVTFGLIAGLIYVGSLLEGPNPVPGQRAGAVIGAAGLIVAFLVAMWLANLLYQRQLGAVVTWGLAGGAGVLIAGLLGFFYLQPGFSNWLVEIESNGWFHARSYKPTQGVRVRRGTLIVLLLIVGMGIYTFAVARLFEGLFDVNPLTRGWSILVPYSGPLGYEKIVFLMYQVQYVAPLVCFAAMAWISWRVVNYPVFADFLIATEAEMNKVSWTTRKRLIQDTIVVLVTVVLLTAFLFVVDLLWIKILSVPGVLQIDPKEAVARQQEASEW